MAEHPLLAKSPNYGAVALVDHLRQVGTAAQHFAPHFGLSPQLAWQGGILHDIGKAHPFFQEVSLGRRQLNGQEVYKYGQRPAFRHEISSLLLLPLFAEEHWPPLIEMVVAHHKAVADDRKHRGLLDLFERDRHFETLHISPWPEWSPAAIELLAQLGVPPQPITEQQARPALHYAIDYCEQLGNGWSAWRGLLMAADHFVSALNERAEPVLPRLFRTPDTSFFNRQSSLFPLSEMPANQAEPHTLVVAPTGAGKTDYLLRRCHKRIFYALPFQASINAMYERLKEAMPQDDVRLKHGASRLVDLESGDAEAAELQAFPGAGVKVLTPFQLASVVFAGFGFEAQVLDVRGHDVILDEIHTYSQEAQAIVLALVERLATLGCRLHIGTATMPGVLYNRLKEVLQHRGGVAEVALSPEQLATYNRHTVHKRLAEEWLEPLQQHVAQGERCLVVFNTVRRAQEAFREIEAAFPGVPKMLLHSRFRRTDRNSRERRLLNEFATSPEACILVSTQVVEVSLDISFDMLLTQAAPLDALIQRMGRVNRKRTRAGIGTLKPVYVLAPEENTLPYSADVVNRSSACLPQDGPLEVNSLQALIDEVYPSLEVQKIEMHNPWNAEGQLDRKQLTHTQEPVLLELLKIDSETCILETDVETYQQAHWATRTQLEIPVSGRAMYPYRDEFRRLEGVGAEPWVIPEQHEYESLGLVLKAPDNFI